jgi:hypothetical protein
MEEVASCKYSKRDYSLVKNDRQFIPHNAIQCMLGRRRSDLLLNDPCGGGLCCFLGFFAFILRNNITCDKLTKSFGMRYFTLYADPGLKMQEYLLTAPGILVIWAVTHPSTNRAQHCLTSVIK